MKRFKSKKGNMADGELLVASVQGLHEEFFEHNCSRCEKKEKNAEASCYCRTCDKYFCSNCRDFHGEFANDHVVLDASESDLWGKPHAIRLDMDECLFHVGQNITIFCEQHEALGCTVCAALTHSSCESQNFVPDLAKDIANSQEMKYVRSSISSLKGRLIKVRSAKEQVQTSLKDSRSNYNETVAEFKIKVDAVLNNLIMTTNDNMDQLYQSRYSELEDHLDVCDTFIQEFDTIDAELADDNIIDTKRFVIMKNGKEKILECMDVLNNLSQPMDYDIIFSLDKSLLGRFKETKSIGRFYPNPAPGKSTEIKRVENFWQHKINANEDKKKCDIQGICMLADGTVLLSDKNNRNIKRLDENYVPRDVIPMPGNPYEICCTGIRSVAVALGSKKKVQMVSVTDKMRTTEAIPFKHYCHGIDYHKGTLFITDNGGSARTLYEYQLVENSGKTTHTLIRTFGATSPRSVSVSGDGKLVYLVGIDDKLMIQNRHGNVVQATEHQNLKKNGGTQSVCVDLKGNIIVAVKSVGIIHFKDSGTEPNGILIKDEITKPEVVFVDHFRSKLIVQRNDPNNLIGGSDTMGVWDLVY